MQKNLILCALTAFLFAACSKDNAKNADGSNATKDQLKACERAPLVDDDTKGGCRIRLVTPKPCEEIDLTDGKTYEFAWTTDGTTCEMPYKGYLAGNPVTKNEDESLNNVAEYQFNENLGSVSKTGGVAQLSAAQLEGLTSTDGTYEWVIFSFHGSHPASQLFRVKK